jgi:hypothetical protein
MTDTSDWKAAHAELGSIFGRLLALAPSDSKTLDGVSSDTIFSLGMTIGTVSRLMALLGRDIDQAASDD